ncbi:MULTISPECIES: hypothetical protein [unclassified Enterococcus]|uniref:hypothetical protein n=1 Tax=unclassified Enterococcus TaxID=2608891 RepID=UPI0015578EF1|nr:MULTISPECIES: hypothetical protein [unclassified Enterococcus]MBS7578304.1 hypothetical protein [Enterococcus sp. MMGLQ5-2]MBS7585485.1 hypothetical protein [Enterococcus sp. MMGLQ5-1]NPD13342.1 hypothetical protein [Enterococcus sp. MMGLQ5-1]NPD38135.1 hypothetical protein [Enterococcus sp. MMGLQ5-2]
MVVGVIKSIESAKERGNNMLLKELVDKLGYDIDKLEASAIPLLNEAYDSMNSLGDVQEQMDILYKSSKKNEQ